MTKETLNTVAAALVLVAFVLLVWGLASAPWMWRAGLSVTAVAYLVALATEWVPEGIGDGEEEGDDEEGGGEDAGGEDDGADEETTGGGRP